ncbi:50S ribosomal protein L18 [Candidatus Nomurabacteria bacterium]|nr:50S ribosomal protein L18 [Candidatus Nomurabacteria bacterium]MCB9820746.1 50S ribosomal protein L18 [Candidatus Nomurabacteria bacterium]
MKTKEQKKSQSRMRIKNRIRSKISGTTDMPRLNIYRSNKFIYAQIIDDTNGNTIASANDMKSKTKGNIDRAKEVGKDIAQKAKAAGITNVVFDRGGFRYAGRIRTLADAARESGLVF